MARRTEPEDRAQSGVKEIGRVRRRYKKDVTKRRKMLPGESEHFADFVIVLKLSNYSNTQIAKLVGMSRGQVKEFIAQPKVADRIEKLKKTLPDAALQIIQMLMVEAVMTIADVMRTESDNALVLKACSEILDRGGMAKTSRVEMDKKTTTKSELSWADDSIVEKLRTASPEIQEQAAKMIEGLEQLLVEHSDKAVETDVAVEKEDERTD